MNNMNAIWIVYLRKKANAKLAKINTIRKTTPTNTDCQTNPEYTAAQAEHRAACVELARATGVPGYK
jgi:hypothetical protein